MNMVLPADKFILFAQHGCSACLRTKEFLSGKKINFVTIDIMNDPGGREKLHELGLRHVPTVYRDGKSVTVLGSSLDDVARFVGLNRADHQSLPPGKLVEKYITVLTAAQRYIRQLPDERLPELIIENRNSSIRLQCHHIFNIADRFVETAGGGVKLEPTSVPSDKAFNTSEELVRYGENVITRLRKWWNELADKSCQKNVQTYFGTQTVHMLLERCTWHSAQHTRQLMVINERLGIEPNGRLTADDLAGLPLPDGLWE